MKKFFITSIILFLTVVTVAQSNKKPVPKEKVPTSADATKMMEEAMKDLSPEEKKMFADAMPMAKMMLDKGIKPNVTSGEVPKIPKKQTALLAKLPVLKSDNQYTAYLASIKGDCIENISTPVIKEVDDFFELNKSNLETLINFGPILLIQKKPSAAIYAAVKIASAQPNNILIQNNLAVLLHQTDNPHKALPILQFLLPQNNHPIIQNNLAQSFLSLGDTSNARKFFMGCLAKDPNSSEANCGIAFMLVNEGKINEAIPYIKKTLKNGYSEIADEIVSKHKPNIKFSDIKQEVPEYFNAQKYKPVPAATTAEMVEETIRLREELKATELLWSQKMYKANEESEGRLEKMTPSQVINSFSGIFTNAPFTKKALLMNTLLGKEYEEYNNFKRKEFLNNKVFFEDRELLAKLETKLSSDTHIGKQRSEFEICEDEKKLINAYLLPTSKNHTDFVQKTIFKEYEFINQSIYWNRFIMSDDFYNPYFTSQVTNFIELLNKYDEMQTIGPYVLNSLRNCKNIKETEEEIKSKQDSIAPMECPIKIEIPIGIGKAKWDCKSFEIEGGELIMGGLEKDFQSGEVTLFLGLGAEFFGKGFGVGGVEAGGKIGSFVKLGKDLSVIDAGNKAEIGIEGGIGLFMTEAKLTGVMGMVSGVKVNQNFVGQETTIFQYGGD